MASIRIQSDVICTAAGVYTQNKVKGAPVTVTRDKILSNGGKAQAVIANSKNANTCNADGVEKAQAMCSLTACELGIDESLVLVASTGVIGQPLPIEPIKNNIAELVSGYKTIEDAISLSDNIMNNPVFIVKDDYSVSDLKELLSKTEIQDYEIYTVKSVNGLEFKEVFVFDPNMSLNEKYISYTRALVKLNVIKFLPETTDRQVTLIVQGEEQEDTSVESVQSDNGI